MSFWLEHEQDGQRQKYTFDTPSISIGRDQGADFVLDHPTVSRQHARIVGQGGAYRLVVLSKGGLTAINGSAVSGEVALSDGNALQIGQFSFVFRADAPSYAQPNSQPGFGGFGAPPSSSGFGAPPASGGFGTPPASGGFGGPPASGGFGAPPASGGFGAPPASGGFGAPPASGGFGAPPASGGFGTPPAPSGFGAPASGGFNQPASPPSGFGTPPSSGGFKTTPPASGGIGQAAGFGQPSGFGQPASSPGQPAPPRDDNHITSWDEIAQSADAMGEKEVAETDFQRLEAAQKKATEKSQRTNPLLILVVLAAVGGTGWFVLDDGPKQKAEASQEISETEPLRFQGSEVDCVGAAECKERAKSEFRVAEQLSQKIEVDIRNRFDAYFKYELALALLEKGGVDPIPPEFASLKTNRDKLRTELDTIFQQRRVRYHDLSKRKMYREMVAILNEVQAIFPYKGARENIWAVKLERDLKDQNLYPMTPY